MIEGRGSAGPGHPGVARAAALAVACRRLALPGPDAAAADRMTRRFSEYRREEHRRGVLAWIGAWVGVGPRPRAAFQRFAAGAALLLAVGTGGGVAAGYPPNVIAAGVRDFAHNAVVNLRPHDENGGPPPVAEATPGAGAAASPSAVTESEGRTSPAPLASPEPEGSAGAVAPPVTPRAAPSATPSPTATVTASPTPTKTPSPSPTPVTPTTAPPVIEEPETPPAATPSPTARPSVTPTPTEEVDDHEEDNTAVDGEHEDDQLPEVEA